jgi:pimeloyl-ACP methyl ester carboxylesterase
MSKLMSCIKRINGSANSASLVSIFLFMVITPAMTIADSHFVYAQLNQTKLVVVGSQNIQDIQVKKVHVGDIDIAYKTFGRGDPILLISGSGNVMDVWPTHFLKELASNHTVIIFDNRGVGNTTVGTRPLSIAQFANDTVGLLNALDIQRTDVLGFSMASFIAQQLTLVHPERVNRLVLYGASCGGHESIPQTQEVTKIISDHVNNRSQDAEAFLSVTFPPEWIRANPNLETFPKTNEIILFTTLVKQFNVVEDWLSRNWSGVCNQLQNISIPTLIITGAEDVAVPAANSLILVQKIPSAWLVQIKGAGHGLMYQYPEEFSEIVKTFLSTTSN